MELQKVRGREKVSAPDLCFPGIFRADRSAKCITGHDNVEQIRRGALPKDCPDCMAVQIHFTIQASLFLNTFKI